MPFSTVDRPGRLSAVVFCQGCPWRCRYCHNTHLQPFTAGDVAWSTVASFLSARRGLIDTVVFSGGEPTAQRAFPAAARLVREMGYEVALHTAGIFPRRLREALPWIDWVGLDIKAPLDIRYDTITQVPHSADAVRKSLAIVLSSGIPHELRTTVHPALLDREARAAIARDVARAGAAPVRWQEFRAQGCRDAVLLRGGD